jgi:hypothetical protein
MMALFHSLTDGVDPLERSSRGGLHAASGVNRAPLVLHHSQGLVVEVDPWRGADEVGSVEHPRLLLLQLNHGDKKMVTTRVMMMRRRRTMR